MTGRRQENKGWRVRSPVSAVISALLLWSVASGAHAAPSERIVTDLHSGLAIGGTDPVSYFTEGEPKPGVEGVEARWGGVIWRFRNDRDRDIFLANPDIYGPQFGGYDPFDLARGKIVAGQSGLWLIAGQRLYLFHKAENKEAFLRDTSHLAKARENWPRLRATLADY